MGGSGMLLCHEASMETLSPSNTLNPALAEAGTGTSQPALMT